MDTTKKKRQALGLAGHSSTFGHPNSYPPAHLARAKNFKAGLLVWHRVSAHLLRKRGFLSRRLIRFFADP